MVKKKKDIVKENLLLRSCLKSVLRRDRGFAKNYLEAYRRGFETGLNIKYSRVIELLEDYTPVNDGSL